uniref:alginate lyase family protein n=1 Tax=Pontiella sp. TaxID=2837462 RepID=UPI0035618A84
MKKYYAAVIGLWFLATGVSHALVVNLDVEGSGHTTHSGQGGHSDPGNNFWNRSADGLTDLTASDGLTETTVDVALSTGSRSAYTLSNDLMADYAYARNNDITVDISGLTPGGSYDLYIYCQGDKLSQTATVSFGGSTNSTTGDISGNFVEGGNFVVLSVTADAGGNLSGTVARNGSIYGVLNGLQIVGDEFPGPMTFVHPGIGQTVSDLDYIQSRLGLEPWKTGYEDLADTSTASLSYTMRGPTNNVGHTSAEGRDDWRSDMRAVHDLARMWYFTENEAYAQKARDILISWATTHTNFLSGETYLDMGYHAHDTFGGADILRGTWSGWTQADTDTCKTYFENVWWDQSHIAVPNPLKSANQGMAQLAAALGTAVFLDDEEKFEQCLEAFRTDAPAALLSSLPNGEVGDTGRDSHDQGQLMLMAWCAEVFWNQGVDVYSEYDNRMLAAGEYIARFNLLADTPFIQFGTVYDIYPRIHTFDGDYPNCTFETKMINLLYTAYVVRKGMRAP